MEGWRTTTIGEQQAKSVTPAAGGTVTAAFTTVGSTDVWEVHRLLIHLLDATGAQAAVGSSAFVFFDTTDVTGQRDATPTGRGDFNVWEAQGSPLLVPSTRTLIVEWTGVPNGYTARAVAQVEVLTPDPASTTPQPFLGVT